MIKQYLIYLGRWQLSTPVLAIVLCLIPDSGTLIGTIIRTTLANLVGGLGFYWVDRLIFKTQKQETIKKDSSLLFLNK